MLRASGMPSTTCYRGFELESRIHAVEAHSLTLEPMVEAQNLAIRLRLKTCGNQEGEAMLRASGMPYAIVRCGRLARLKP